MNRNFGWDHREEILSSKTLSDAPDSLFADMEALRTHDRFGISSWPQMIVMDPRDDRVIGMPERTVESVTGLFDRAIAEIPDPGERGRKLGAQLEKGRRLLEKGRTRRAERILWPIATGSDRFYAWQEAMEILGGWPGGAQPFDAGLADPDPTIRATALEILFYAIERGADNLPRNQVLMIRSHLLDENEDIVVRQRALWCLAATDPNQIMFSARELLSVPNDPFRYRVLSVIEKTPDPSLGPVLIEIFEGAGTTIPSLNPNVLRINVVRCLRESGDASCIDALAEIATEPDPRNYLNGLIVEVIGEIGQRGDPTLKDRVLTVLMDSFPAALDTTYEDPQEQARMLRMHLTLAGKVVTSIGNVLGVEPPSLPQSWTAADRSELLRKLSELIGRHHLR